MKDVSAKVQRVNWQQCPSHLEKCGPVELPMVMKMSYICAFQNGSHCSYVPFQHPKCG